VAEAGVGTIAAGVAKAYADFVHIAGHAGGTGASALSSIKHAGSPWELGLAETQQVLMRNGLRSRIRVRTDGGLMTGRDVVIAALLGAEEFGFGTAPLVAMGCDMARQCHLDTCPTGIATQRPELRDKFRGRPEHVIHYFHAVAQEARELLAWLGLATIADAVGRVDLLRQTRAPARLDLGRLLARPQPGALRRCMQERNDRPAMPDEPGPDFDLCRVALSTVSSEPVRIRNRDRSVGARLSGDLARSRLERPATGARIELRFRGSAGQSFGAFGARGLRFVLTGEANDYVAKGLSGAELVLRPAGLARIAPHDHVILGNVALYGATSGRLLAAGRAGERFAIRNSGAEAVVEGVGDHGCEYMTGGRVVVLGEVGWNFGAGMTGGTAWILDAHHTLETRLNAESVTAARATDEELESVRRLLEIHVRSTGSARGAEVLSQWSDAAGLIHCIRPVGAVMTAPGKADAVATETTGMPASGPVRIP
jgi:glutamate synthase domain-containing protein 3